MADNTTDEPKNRVGRPLKYSRVEELQAAIDAYFQMQDPHLEEKMVETGVTDKGETIFMKRKVMTEQKPYTVSGLALALGVSRQTLLNYREREEYFDSIALAVQRCESYAESQLYGPFANGAKFNLINNYRGEYQDWADKHAVDHTTKDQPIPLLAGLAPAELVVEDDDGSTAQADDGADEDQQS